MADDPHEWWSQLPDERRDKLNEYARESLLQLDVYPFGNAEVAAELNAWVHLETEIVAAYGDWLERVKTSIERRGLDYNRTTFLRYCELREHE